MKTALCGSSWLAVGALCAGLTLSLQAQTTVYDNLANYPNGLGSYVTIPSSGNFIGDEIHILPAPPPVAGVAQEWNMTNFVFTLYSSVNGDTSGNTPYVGNPQMQVVFYDLNPTTLQPQNILWASGFFSISYLDGVHASVVSGAKIIFPNDDDPLHGNPNPGDIPINGVGLPPFVSGNIVWGVEVTGLQPGDVLGLEQYGPPDIGSSVTFGGTNTFYWENLGSDASPDWVAPNYAVTNGPPLDFGAQIEATPVAAPEPSVVALSLFGGLSLLVAARRVARRV
jgi:hypothetical protein